MRFLHVVTIEREKEMSEVTITLCGVCGRPLRDAKSIERGMGPTCAEKVQSQSEDDS